jgi:hypothetical protein
MIELLLVRRDIDEKVIAQLQTEEMLRFQQAAQLKEALGSCRGIGAAIGIIMATTR